MSLFGGGHKSAAQTPTRAMGLDLQGAQYGAPIPVVFGRNKLAGNVIDYFEFKAIAHTQKQQGGKGGGGGGQTSTSYTYSVSYLLGLHEGVGNVVNVYDGSSLRSLSSVGGLAFTGAQGQAPWSHLSGDAALGYSGTVLVAFQNKDLGSSASLPNYNFEVDGRNQFSASIKDANPGDIVTAICTDSQIGINFSALGDLTAFKNYCTAAGIFFSPVYDTQNPAQSTLEDLFKYANSAAFFSEGKLKVVPYGDETITGNGVTYAPNLTAVVDLGRDDFITNGTDDPVTVRRVAPADAMNIVRLEYKDRANTYHTMPAVASFDQDVVGTGSRADQSESVDMITDGAVARLVVQNLLQRTYYIRNTYEFQLSWRYCDLEPMDIVTLTDGNTGLYQTPVRITEITEDEHGLLQVTAEEFPEGVSHASIYATQPNAGTGVDPNADPGPITSPYLFRGPGFLVPSNQPEIWVAVSGVDPMWAGCDVYLSQDGTSYTYLTTHSRRAAYGETTNSLAAGSDPDTTGAPNVVLNGPVELLGGTQADADQFITLAMIDNELVAYQTATLAGGPSYTLGYLRRGGYGTAQTSHAAGAPFVRLDENILRIPVDPSQIGQAVYLKFVSFNVFGKGGRTLADETAYTYIVGTNIELPDVPVTPNSPAVTAVADGVSITWFNPNPAAVGCTSIEYATASGGPWTVLAQVGPTATSYVHHFTTGATYYYRLRSRGAVISAGWSAYTAVLTNKGKTVQDGADNTGSVTGVPVYNPVFSKDLSGWTFDTANAGEWVRGTGGNSPDAAQTTFLQHNGVAGQTTTCAHNTGGGIAVKTGQTVTALVALRSVGANAGSRAYVRIGWYDSTGAAITNSTQGVTICTPDAGSTYFSQGVSRVYGTAPANAVRALVEIEFDNHTSGSYTATSAWIAHGTQSADEVPESDVRKWAAESGATNGFNKGANLLLNPSGVSGFLGWNGGWIGGSQQSLTTRHDSPVGTAFACTTTGTATDQGFSQVVLSPSGIGSVAFTMSGQFYTGHMTGGSHFVEVRQTDVNGAEISGAPRYQIFAAIGVNAWQFLAVTFTTVSNCHGLSFICRNNGTGDGGQARWAQLKLEIGSKATPFTYSSPAGDQLGVAGSGIQLGDLRNQVMVGVGNFASAWSGGAITYSASSTSATITAGAATLVAGNFSKAYNQASTTVGGSAGATTKYYLYYDDSDYSGGSQTLHATTSVITSLNSNGRLKVGEVTVTFPTSGTGGGTGNPGCVAEGAWVIKRGPGSRWVPIRARDAKVGDWIRGMDPNTGRERWVRISYRRRFWAEEMVTVYASERTRLTCTPTGPLGTPGLPVLARDAADARVAAKEGGWFTYRQARVAAAAPGWAIHFTAEHAFFLAGDEPQGLLAHHNMKPAN